MMKKILAILVALATVLSLAACGNYEININKVEDETQAEDVENNEEAKDDKKEDKEDEDFEVAVTKKEQKKDDGKTAKKLSAKKIGTIKDDDETSYTLYEGGFVYKTNGKYGVMSLDGKKDTGAKYFYAESEGEYFKVIDKQPGEAVEEQNCFTLITAEGKEVIPGKFATFDILNDRYIKVVIVDKLVDDKDDALVYATDRQYTVGAQDGDTLYGGNWYIYDITTGKQVPGATGTQGFYTYAYGDVVEYITDTSNRKYVNAAGEELPEDAEVFENGCYVIDGKSEVYDSEGNAVFSYDPTGYVPSRTGGDNEEYYFACLYLDGEYEYVILDAAGKKVNDLKFDSIPTIKGRFILFEKVAYTMSGKKVDIKGVNSINSDGITDDYYIISNDTTYYLVDRDGNILNSIDDEVSVSGANISNFSLYKRVDNQSIYYCVADDDYTVKGYILDAWLLTEDAGNSYENLVDLISGETLLKKYENYESQLVEGVGTYVYADNGDGKIEVYLITAE